MSEHSARNPNGSTGPRSPEGKNASSKNSTTHGLCSRVILLPGESETEWQAVLALFRDEYDYRNPIIESLAEQTALAQWFFMRATRRYQETEAALANEQPDPLLWTEAQHKLLERMLRYRTTHERAYHRALSLLERLGKTALKAAVEIVQLARKRIKAIDELDQLRLNLRKRRALTPLTGPRPIITPSAPS